MPTLENDICNGSKKPTTCIIHPTAIPTLSLPINSTQEEINNALIIALNSAVNRITALETLTEDLEQRVLAIENI